MQKQKFSAFSASAGSYLVYLIIGMILLSPELQGFDGLREAFPAISSLDDGMINMIITAYMVIDGVMILFKGVQSLIGLGFLAVPCIIADLAYIALHMILFNGATTGASMALIFFFILSGISIIMNIVSLGGRR